MVGSLRVLFYMVLVFSGLNSPGSNVLLISSNFTGKATGNGHSAEIAVTPDGRYLAFTSSASDFGGSDTNTNFDVYLLDCATGARKCISSPSNFPPFMVPAPAADSPVISDDGRFVGFRANHSLLVPQITNYPSSRPWNFFVYDTVSNRYFLGSPNGNARTAFPNDVQEGTLSSDGRYSSFVVGMNIYRADLEAGTTDLVNADLNGTAALISNVRAQTPDHRYFIFASGSTNMVAGLSGTDQTGQVYCRDMDEAVTRLVSVATDGGYGNVHCFARAISPDGRYIAFQSSATNLQSGMGGHQLGDLFIRDMVVGETWCVTVNSNGTASLGNSTRLQQQRFSADSRRLLFQASWVPSPPYNFLYVHDIASRTNRLLATNTWEGMVDFSDDGRYALYTAGSFELRSVDVETLRAQRIGGLGGAFPPFSGMRITAHGQRTFFVSYRNEAAGISDTNSQTDIFTAPTVSPRIESVVGTQERTLDATAYPGDTVRLQTSDDLRNWTDVESRTASNQGTLRFEDADGPNSVQFYRLVSP